MISLTEQIINHSNGLLTPQPEDKFTCFNTGGVEVEVGEVLHALIRALKPQHVLETGTHWGISSLYMGLALKENNQGGILTLEIFKENKEKAEKLWQQFGLDNITCILLPSLEFETDKEFDFIFLDSEPEIRFKELIKFYQFLEPGGFMAIHDCPEGMCQGNVNPDHPDFKSWPYGDMPWEMKSLLKEKKLIRFNLPNPRGSSWFYKPTESYFNVKA